MFSVNLINLNEKNTAQIQLRKFTQIRKFVIRSLRIFVQIRNSYHS